MIDALIVAAGRGLRMQAKQRKQYLELAGRPILTHTLLLFDRHPEVNRIFLTLPEDDLEFCRKTMIAPAGLRNAIHLVAGGDHRQASVLNGLRSIPETDGIVLIHDGVRPLVTPALISACIAGARTWGACIPVIKALETLKKVTPNGCIEQTVDRETICMAQTPQAFRLAWIRQAHESAVRHGWTATDDASLLEQMGTAVHVIDGSRSNLKITRPEDLALAEAIFSGKRQSR